MRKQNGITLIALVITIIVLLILAGISIAMLTGENGILTNTTEATVTNIEARVDEEVKLAIQAVKLVIENQTAKDNSWDATVDVKKAGADELVCSGTTPAETTHGVIFTSLIADLKADGYSVKGSTDGSSITIKYTGSDYTNATNYDSASITYALTVTQHEVKLTPVSGNDTNPTIVKD